MGIVSVVGATLVSAWAVCESPSRVSGPDRCFRMSSGAGGGGKLD